GGAVTVGTVTAQLLYEIGGPLYANPDVVADFSTIRLEEAGPDRVRVSGVRGRPAPDKVKVSVNLLGGWRNSMTFVLTGLDVEEKAELVRRTLHEQLAGDDIGQLDLRLLRTDRPDAPSNEQASAQFRVTVKDSDPAKVGRRFSSAVTELALASYPGFYLTSPPADAAAYGVYWPLLVPPDVVDQVAVLPDGRRVPVPVLPPATAPLPAPVVSEPTGPAGNTTPEPAAGVATRRVPLGVVAGARSGDKGGNANVGLWARDDAGYQWLAAELTVGRLRQLLPEAATLGIERYELPNLRAVNFVIRGLLGEGVASSTRPDPQAKSLGEYLRSRLVEVPVDLLGAPGN
ncbi:MAG TPA: acyclic terpene utilization AtuA family protein, partial [Acidimicrobiales bacterium]|nr:acyclic terpene utilization AtuA family protein [Acidimicrobiales bacterium]